MQYVGSKQRQAKYIAENLQKHGTACVNYLEPFVGGGSVFSLMASIFPGNAHGSDAHEDLALMWSAAIDGWEPPAAVSREEYASLKKSEPSALRGFVGFGCSFGGKWFGGYASNAVGHDYCGAARRGLLRKVAGMRSATFTCADYRTFSPGTGTLVYCDPPYANTTGYSLGQFDSNEFWTTMQSWSSDGAVVLVSEYTAPHFAEEVWSRAAKRSLSKDENKSASALEKLFRIHAA